MKIYVGRNLKDENIYWDTFNRNFLYIASLSGGGKSYLASEILNQFLAENYQVYIISDKARVDYKRTEPIKISPHEEMERLKEFIQKTSNLMTNLKIEVENSEFTHISNTGKSLKIAIFLDELWSTDKLPKDLRASFNDLIELIIRQGRYLNICLICLSQTFKSTESAIPIKHASVVVLGRTDTREASLSVMDSDIGYSSPLKPGQFIYWLRGKKPIVITVKPEKRSLLKVLWNLLKQKLIQ